MKRAIRRPVNSSSCSKVLEGNKRNKCTICMLGEDHCDYAGAVPEHLPGNARKHTMRTEMRGCGEIIITVIMIAHSRGKTKHCAATVIRGCLRQLPIT